LYPLKFNPIYIKKIWAGSKLKSMRSNISDENIGISWEISAHRNADTIINNGRFNGKNLSKLLNEEKENVLGAKISPDQFLRIAYLDADEDLSIQVHPDSEYARINENDGGKNESWYILDAKENAYVIAGVSITDKEILTQAVKDGSIENYIKKIPVKKGDIVVIKTGVLHALGNGILAIEIGQNSDTTYRLYDYNRGRKIDIEKSFDVIKPELKGFKPKYLSVDCNDYVKSYCFCGKEYAIELISVKTLYKNKTNGERFYIYTCVGGQCCIDYNSGSELLSYGESVLIPASMGDYAFKGKCVLLRSYIPDVDKLSEEILKYIKY